MCAMYNVVFHEFAHQLDSTCGQGDSSAVLQQRWNLSYCGQVSLIKTDKKLQQDLSSNRPTLLGSYAGQDPAEFFPASRTCTVSIFVRPR